jgi:hypothetical protein
MWDSQRCQRGRRPAQTLAIPFGLRVTDGDGIMAARLSRSVNDRRRTSPGPISTNPALVLHLPIRHEAWASVPRGLRESPTRMFTPFHRIGSLHDRPPRRDFARHCLRAARTGNSLSGNYAQRTAAERRLGPQVTVAGAPQLPWRDRREQRKALRHWRDQQQCPAPPNRLRVRPRHEPLGHPRADAHRPPPVGGGGDQWQDLRRRRVGE